MLQNMNPAGMGMPGTMMPAFGMPVSKSSFIINTVHL